MNNDTDDTFVHMGDEEECDGIHLGDSVVDIITGFEGVVTGLFMGIGGEEIVYVQAPYCDEQGVPIEEQEFSSSRVERIPNEEKTKELAS